MKYIIPQKMSGTGTIHDIASEHYDREITGVGCYAVVLAAYYGGRGYTTHKSPEAVIRQAKRVANYSYTIIDEDGKRYAVYGDELQRL